MSILSTNVEQKLLETEFSIAICRPTGDIYLCSLRAFSIAA